MQYVYPVNTPQHQAAQQGVASASCTLGPSSPEGLVRGLITLHQNHPGAPVLVSGSVEGLIPGLHGFHMHRDGNTADGCKAAGPHFNPANVSISALCMHLFTKILPSVSFVCRLQIFCTSNKQQGRGDYGRQGEFERKWKLSQGVDVHCYGELDNLIRISDKAFICMNKKVIRSKHFYL